MSSVHGRAIRFRLATLLLLTFLTGCYSLQEALPPEPSEEEQLIANLRKSVDLLRGSLKTTVRERDQFKQNYISNQAELTTARGDAEYLETRVRLYRDRLETFEEAATERDHVIATQQAQLDQQQEVARSQQETVDRLRNRTRAADGERQELERQVIAAEQRTESLEAQVKQLERAAKGAESIVAQAKLSTTEREAAQAEQITAMSAELAQLRGDMVALESRAASAEAALQKAIDEAPVPQVEIAMNPQTADPVNAGEFFVSWWGRGWDEITNGKFGEAARSFVTCVGSAIVLIVLLAFLWVRGAGAQKRAVNLEKQLQAALSMSTTSGVMRRSAATAKSASAAAATTAAAPHLDQTIQIPKTVPEQPPGAAVGAPPESVNIPLENPEISQSLDNALNVAEGNAPRDRQVIGAEPKSSDSIAVRSGEDEELLKDLKSVIRDKFSDL
ncbi:MAG: hypothetical protein AAF581_22705 [Planctomycetota bacterium]